MKTIIAIALLALSASAMKLSAWEMEGDIITEEQNWWFWGTWETATEIAYGLTYGGGQDSATTYNYFAYGLKFWAKSTFTVEFELLTWYTWSWTPTILWFNIVPLQFMQSWPADYTAAFMTCTYLKYGL